MTEAITTAAGIITACGVIFGLLFSLFRWLEGRRKNDEDIKQIKDEQCLLTYAVLACLKGLAEQGCDGPVREASTALGAQALAARVMIDFPEILSQ